MTSMSVSVDAHPAGSAPHNARGNPAALFSPKIGMKFDVRFLIDHTSVKPMFTDALCYSTRR